MTNDLFLLPWQVHGQDVMEIRNRTSASNRDTPPLHGSGNYQIKSFSLSAVVVVVVVRFVLVYLFSLYNGPGEHATKIHNESHSINS